MEETVSVMIHRLGRNDVPLMRQMNALFGIAFDDLGSYAATPPSDDYLTSLLDRDTFIALVAITDGIVIGGLASYELHKFEKARSEIYIYDLAVAETHRRQGIARSLINELQDIAAQRKCWVIYVQADYGDDPAIALYTSMGEREEVMHFDIPVPRRA